MDVEDDVEDVIADIILLKIYLGYNRLVGKGFPSLSVMLRWNLWIILLFAVGIFLLGKEYEGKPLKPYAIDIPDCRFEVEEAYDTVHGGYIYTIHHKTGDTPEPLTLPSDRNIVAVEKTLQYSSANFRYKTNPDYLLLFERGLDGEVWFKRVYDIHGPINEGWAAYTLRNPYAASSIIFGAVLIAYNLLLMIFLRKRKRETVSADHEIRRATGGSYAPIRTGEK